MLANKLLAAMAGGEEKLYAEDVFSAYTSVGTVTFPTRQTVTTGLNLTGANKGLIWVKNRQSTNGHFLFDTVRGNNKYLSTDATAAESTDSSGVNFTSTGFTIGAPFYSINKEQVAWTFKAAPKFFDVVTYTGNATDRTIAHSLGEVPGTIIIKRTDSTSDWNVYHRSIGNTKSLLLNTTGAESTRFNWNNTDPTSSVFTVSASTEVNASGGAYVAYLFAHDTGTDGLIQCGSFTTDGGGAGPFVDLGWEPQFVLYKDANYVTGAGGDWNIVDSSRGMRGYAGLLGDPMLEANTTAAEQQSAGYANATATGFYGGGTASHTYIYLAIRRPNKPPTVGTQVYNAIARTGTGAAATVTGVGFAPDLVIPKIRNTTTGMSMFRDRLRGIPYLTATTTASEVSTTGLINSLDMDGMTIGSSSDVDSINSNGSTFINHFFKRAPGVFDVVCYTGTGVAHTEAHSLGVVPELIIVKSRQDSTRKNWVVYAASQGNTKSAWLEATGAFSVTGYTEWSNTSPTASVFTIGTEPAVNQNGYTYVCYLFATLAGISKVGSYTGNGTTNAIDCGFTTGARFVLIKRTDSTGDWYVWDTVRGIIAGNDPYLLLNSTAAEVTSTDYIDPVSTGFELSSTAPAAINANGGSFIYLAFS